MPQKPQKYWIFLGKSYSGYDFVIMVKGMNSFVSDLILENKGKFENSGECNIRQYKTYGMTVKRQLYASDTKERYFHLFYSDHKAAAEREQIDARMERMMRYLDSLKGQRVSISEGYKSILTLKYMKKMVHFSLQENGQMSLKENGISEDILPL